MILVNDWCCCESWSRPESECWYEENMPSEPPGLDAETNGLAGDCIVLPTGNSMEVAIGEMCCWCNTW